MSIFRKAGEKFEETKRAFVDGTKEEYRCRSCEEQVAEDYDCCPHCGKETVVLVE